MTARHRSTFTLPLVVLLAVACTATPVATPGSPPPSDTPASSSATDLPTPSPVPTPTASITATPEPSPRIFTSDDGLLTIEAPPGAMPDDVELTATAQGPDDAPPELAGIQMRSAFYLLEPDGLTFSKPVMVTRRGNISDMGYDLDEDGIPIISLALRTSDGAWSWLEDQEIDVDGDDLVVSGKASHTSMVMGFGGTTFVRRDISEPSARVPVGQTFSVFGALDYRASDGAQPLFGATLGPYAEGDAATIGDSSPDHGVTFQQDFLCQNNGTSWVGVAVDIDGVASGQFFGRLELAPTSTELYVGIDLNCFTPTQTPTSLALAFDACFRTVHQSLGDFASYLLVLVYLAGESRNVRVESFSLTVEGANDGHAYQLRYDVDQLAFAGELGLHNAGKKRIVRLVAHLDDGSTVDLTQDLIAKLGGEEINVRFPQEDEFGRCEDQ